MMLNGNKNRIVGRVWIGITDDNKRELILSVQSLVSSGV
jgi:hypothetical protein